MTALNDSYLNPRELAPPSGGRTIRVIASCFALTAFAVALVAGLAGGNAMLPILGRAVLIMTVCYPIGFAVGLVAAGVIERHEADITTPRAEPASAHDDGGEATV